MNISEKEKKGFVDEIVKDVSLENAIIWINNELCPEDVFEKRILEEWAEENGFVKED